MAAVRFVLRVACTFLALRLCLPIPIVFYCIRRINASLTQASTMGAYGHTSSPRADSVKSMSIGSSDMDSPSPATRNCE